MGVVCCFSFLLNLACKCKSIRCVLLRLNGRVKHIDCSSQRGFSTRFLTKQLTGSLLRAAQVLDTIELRKPFTFRLRGGSSFLRLVMRLHCSVKLAALGTHIRAKSQVLFDAFRSGLMF